MTALVNSIMASPSASTISINAFAFGPSWAQAIPIAIENATKPSTFVPLVTS